MRAGLPAVLPLTLLGNRGMRGSQPFGFAVKLCAGLDAGAVPAACSHVRGDSVETELVALDVLHHKARLVIVIGRQ